MNDLERDIAGARRAHAAVLATVASLNDADVAQPSRLPGWTVGHVATHIARNAEGQLRMFDAARHGEVGQMYPGGRTQRNADIEAGAGRPAALIAADVTATATALEEAWAELPEDLWSASGESVAGPVILRDLPFIRWREAIVHHSDLGLTSTWEQWDPEYVRLELGRLTMLWASRKPMGLTQLPEAARRAPAHRRVAWLLGRTDIDGLDPAGIMG